MLTPDQEQDDVLGFAPHRGPPSIAQPTTVADDRGHHKGCGGEPHREGAAEHAGLHGQQLDVDRRADDKEHQPRQQRKHRDAGGHERVGLRAQGQDHGQQRHGDDAEQQVTGEMLEHPGRHQHVQGRGRGGTDHQIRRGLQEVVASRLGEHGPARLRAGARLG